MKQGIVIALAVVGALALMCVGGMVFGGMWLARNMGPPEGITVQVAQPPSVRSGETFNLVVTVTNALAEARTIRDIDLHEGLPEGLTLVGSEPPYADFDPSMGFWTLTMDHPLAANAAATITLTITAGAPGVYQGDFDVSVDEILKINTTPLVITVDPAP